MTNEFKIRNAILVNSFTEESVRAFKADFDDLKNSNLPIIPVLIDSYGGEVYALLAMLDILSTSDRPVATIAIGKAMSCGSILLSCGGSPGLRFIGPNCTVMIHDVGSFSFGKIEDLKADVFEAERLNNKVFELMNEKSGKEKGYFQSLVANKKHVNWYLDAKEALKHGLVDHVGLPVIESLFNLNVIRDTQNKQAQPESAPKPTKTPKVKKDKKTKKK
jgi:ATP-dependent Clp endopeptidase proteolytic subunit ClpP